jgi:hypothetical protein
MGKDFIYEHASYYDIRMDKDVDHNGAEIKENDDDESNEEIENDNNEKRCVREFTHQGLGWYKKRRILQICAFKYTRASYNNKGCSRNLAMRS